MIGRPFLIRHSENFSVNRETIFSLNALVGMVSWGLHLFRVYPKALFGTDNP
jgi:hypothetical protein